MAESAPEKTTLCVKLKDGLLHNEAGPAVIYSDGSRWYCCRGQLHRDDGPAIEWADGTKEWYCFGEHRRGDGPAIEWADGTKWWEEYRGQPAIEWSDGTKTICDMTAADWRQDFFAAKISQSAGGASREASPGDVTSPFSSCGRR